jgi:TonB family protein
MKKKNILLALSIIVLTGGIVNAASEQAAVKAPEAIKIVQPKAPVLQVRMGLTDTVVVTFQINEAGRPVKIKAESYQDPAYAKAVEDAVRKWRFAEPTEQNVTYRQVANFS